VSVSYEGCVLSGRGVCDGPITRPKKFSECGDSECDLETSTIRRRRPTRAVELLNYLFIIIIIIID
jgi:hypothetical protein